MNYSLLASIGLGLLCLFVFPERYTRTDIDIRVEVEDEGDTIHTQVSEQVHVYYDGHIENA